MGGNKLAAETFENIVDHLQKNNIDTGKNFMNLGPWMKIDAENQNITAVDGATNGAAFDTANLLLKDVYRPPFELKG
jgi:hypothetical protein